MSTVFDAVLRPAIMKAADSQRIKRISQRLPITQRVVNRFVPGETLDEVMRAIHQSLDAGLSVTIDHLGEDITAEAQATATVEAYLALLQAMTDHPADTPELEVSVKLTALGQSLPRHGHKIAEENAHAICTAARRAGILVTVDAEDHTTIDTRLQIVRSLRKDFADVGTVLQASLRRTEDDCTDFATAGARIRLCKGAYAEPASVAYPQRRQIDDAYLRCLRILMKGNGYPMVASHDPTMIKAARMMAAEVDRAPENWEHQMLYGIRTDEQRRLVEGGARVRVYIPYGQEWYGYFVRRLAEKPANLRFFLRAVAG